MIIKTIATDINSISQESIKVHIYKQPNIEGLYKLCFEDDTSLDSIALNKVDLLKLIELLNRYTEL